MGSSSIEHQDRKLEDTIFAKLSQWQRRYPDGDGPRDLELEGLIYQFLYKNLRCLAPVLPGLGKPSVDLQRDVSCRFTSVLNEAFARILERYPDKLLQARSRSQLTGYVSRTMVNLMVSHYRRQSVWNRVAATLGVTEGEEALVRDILSNLCDERRDYFEQRTGVSFQEGLNLLQAWDASDDSDERQYAEVLRRRYIDQLGYEQIAWEMSGERKRLSKQDVENLLERAKYHLKKLRGKG